MRGRRCRKGALHRSSVARLARPFAALRNTTTRRACSPILCASLAVGLSASRRGARRLCHERLTCSGCVSRVQAVRRCGCPPAAVCRWGQPSWWAAGGAMSWWSWHDQSVAAMAWLAAKLQHASLRYGGVHSGPGCASGRLIMRSVGRRRHAAVPSGAVQWPLRHSRH